MADMQHTTKRVQIDKAKATMLGLLVATSIITVFALVASKSFFSQAQYLSKVAAAKKKVVNQLKLNQQASTSLVAAYQSFSSQNPNLLGGTNTGNGEKDGDNGRLILDALPSKYDFPALATSLEKLLTGYQVNSITGSDDVAAQNQIVAAQTVDMPFSVEVSTDYKGVQTLLNTFERSIRPFQVMSLQMTGTNAVIKTTISAKTFYQPGKDLKIETMVIK
jgi:hypothetical protein